MEKQQKNKFVRDIKKGEILKDLFAVAGKDAVKTYQKGHMFTMKLQDKTGTMALKFFGSNDKTAVDAVHSSILIGSVVRIDANANEYNGVLELTVNPPQQAIEVIPTGAYELEHFVLHTKKDIAKMAGRLRELIDGIEDADIKKVMKHIFSEEMIRRFSASSAAVKRHHAFVGGLLEHSLSLAEILLTVQEMHPELNRDYLVCGALLQDIGKTEEIKGDIAFDFTMEGSLVGHIVLGAQMIAKATGEMKTPKEKALKLMHLVITHHNELEKGSPITPKFPEAAAVAHADELDAKVQEFIEKFEAAKNSTEGDTVYEKALQRYLYLK